MRVITRFPLVLALLGTIALATPALATTEIRLTGSGVLRITTTGNLHFGGLDLVVDQAVLIADQFITLDMVGSFPLDVPDTTLVYDAVSGTTVLEFDENVYLPFLAFDGSIDFRARNIVIHGGIDVTGALWVGSALDPGVVSCRDMSGTIVSSGNTSTGLCPPTPVIGGIDTFPPVGPIGPIGVTAVPEPGAALLFAAGAALIGVRLRRSH